MDIKIRSAALTVGLVSPSKSWTTKNETQMAMTTGMYTRESPQFQAATETRQEKEMDGRKLITDAGGDDQINLTWCERLEETGFP